MKREVFPMQTLQEWAGSPLWDGEQTKAVYSSPVAVPRSLLVHMKVLWLTVGIPWKQLYRRNKFWCARSTESHIGPYKHAIDFLIPDETDVHAMRSGEVVEICDQYEKWGPTAEFRGELNYMTIAHQDGEFSQYCHLGKSSVTEQGIRIGSMVSAGQVIARVGKTGWTDRDHLHVLVFRANTNKSPFQFKSLRIRFA